MIGTSPLFIATILDPGMVLFGVLILLYGAALTVVFLLRKVPELARLLGALTLVLLVTLDGHVLLNLLLPSVRGATPSATRLTFLLLEHRWFLLELAGVLLLTSAIVLFVYGSRLVQSHARHYHRIVIFSILVSFVSILTSALESALR